MRTIYKYHLKLQDSTVIQLPVHAEILKVAPQGDTGMLWAEVETDNSPEDRRFAVYGTGWPISNADRLQYIDSIFIGPFVWHVYEVKY
jgi:hypothetical protein